MNKHMSGRSSVVVCWGRPLICFANPKPPTIIVQLSGKPLMLRPLANEDKQTFGWGLSHDCRFHHLNYFPSHHLDPRSLLHCYHTGPPSDDCDRSTPRQSCHYAPLGFPRWWCWLLVP